MKVYIAEAADRLVMNTLIACVLIGVTATLIVATPLEAVITLFKGDQP